MSLLGFKESNQMYDIYNNDPENCTSCNDIHIIKNQKQFNQVEEGKKEVVKSNIDVSTVMHAKHTNTMIRSK